MFLVFRCNLPLTLQRCCIIGFCCFIGSSASAEDAVSLKTEAARKVSFKAEKGAFYQLEQKKVGAQKWEELGKPVEGNNDLKEIYVSDAMAEYQLRKLNKQWVLVWNDEFNDNKLDPSKWAREENGYGGGNNERQFYSTDKKYAHTKNGLLHVSAYRDPHTTVDGKTQPYTSGRIRTIHRAEWKYGRFEIRAKMPGGQGIWPAVWMLPTESPYGGWASSGEIDIIESRGSKVEETVGSLHFGGPWPRNTHLTASYQFPKKNAAEDFHTYVVEWNKDQITWAVNGHIYQTIKKEQWRSEKAPKNPSAPFDHPFHLIINVAVDGGFFKGTQQKSDLLPDAQFPQTLLIDYVRVYQWAE
ncbi:MAG: glycoside hydrolase family 16 protein [Akkermansiaceae bacterium]